VVERYKEINDSLDDIEKNLKRINRESDKLFGAARLKQMDKAQEQLKK
jgi:tetrahydromethanopterin S-methyltransferase subunit G